MTWTPGWGVGIHSSAGITCLAPTRSIGASAPQAAVRSVLGLGLHRSVHSPAQQTLHTNLPTATRTTRPIVSPCTTIENTTSA